jgi:uncharacterized protein YdhG (YjbR/CyaY superfamily)
MKTDRTQPRNTDEYIAGFPRAVRSVLERVRRAIRTAVPNAEEGISYKIPTYKMHGRPVLYFAAWTEHYSLYPSTDRLVAAFKDELAPYEVSKGTIRFPLSEPVPVRLIERIAKFRAKEVAERSPFPLGLDTEAIGGANHHDQNLSSNHADREL